MIKIKNDKAETIKLKINLLLIPATYSIKKIIKVNTADVLKSGCQSIKPIVIAK